MEAPGLKRALWSERHYRSVVLTCVSNDLLPRLPCQDVEEQRGNDRSQRPESDGTVSAAAGHGERTTLVTSQTSNTIEKEEEKKKFRIICCHGQFINKHIRSFFVWSKCVQLFVTLL